MDFPFITQRKTQGLNRLLAAWMFVQCCLGGWTATLYVSPAGSDHNPGTSKAPLATPAGARDRIRQLGVAGKEKVTVEFRTGTYRLQEPFLLRTEDSGTQKYPVIYRAEKGARVEWSGAVSLKPIWTALSNGIWQASVPKGLPTDQLFVNGKRQILARFPNFDPGQRILGGFSKESSSPTRAARWKNPAGGYLHAMHRHEWGDVHYRILRKNDDGTLSLEGGWQNNRSEEGVHEAQRFVENIFEELDAPGEWFLDSTAGSLYFKPSTGIDLQQASIELPTIKHLVEFHGSSTSPVRFVQLQGFTLKHTLRTFMENREPLLRSDWTTYRGGAVLFDGAEDCTLSESTLEQVGGNGVFVNGYNRRVKILGCEINEAGASSILFVGSTNAVRSPLFNYHRTLPTDRLDLVPGPKTAEYPADCLVEDCLLTGNGRVEKQSAGVHIAMSARITVRNCSIYNCPRAGINIGDGCWGGHVIEFCDIFDTVKETGDHGSFNSWGRDRFWVPNIQEGNRRVAANPNLPLLDVVDPIVLRNNRWRCDHGWDIDLDDGSSNYVLENNLCLNGGIKLREGFNRRVENNIMVNNSFHPHVWFAQSRDLFRKNITMAGYYPIGMPKVWGEQIDFNLLPNSAALARARERGTDASSMAGEPQFVNAAAGDFRVKSNSPALQLGFKNFPMDRFGVQRKNLRAKAATPVIPAIKGNNSPADGTAEATLFWLGATLKKISSLGERSAAGLAEETGMAMIVVPEQSPASRLGFKTRDVILKINRTEIRNLESWKQAVTGIPTGTKVVFTLQRDQKQTKLETVVPSTSQLDAGSARIFGDFPLPNYDAARGFIGAWTTLNSGLEWKFKSPGTGKFRVWMESACADASAGSVLQIQCGSGQLETKVAPTGGWDKFQTRDLGILLCQPNAAGDCVITLTPKSKPGQAVMNFRTLHLIPEN